MQIISEKTGSKWKVHGRSRRGIKPLYLFILLLVLFLTCINFELPADLNDDFVSIEKIVADYHARFFWDPLTEMGTLELENHTITLKPSVNFVILDYSEKVTVKPPVLRDGEILVPKEAIGKIGKVVGEKGRGKGRKRVYPHISVIMIDPGHGGKDPGTIGRNVIKGKLHVLKEKDLVLKIGRYVRDMLANRYPAKKIIMTRSKDVYPTLEDRVRLANSIKLDKNEAMIFISIHANASFNKKAHGYEIWYLPPEYRRKLLTGNEVDENTREILPILNSMLEEEYTVESITLARNILEGLKKEVGDKTVSRGLKAQEWYVVRKAKMPSVLIEVGFVTNPEEMLLLEEDSYLKRLSKGIYNGICKFISGFENTKGFTE